jgi:hypothetical protein
MTDASFSSILDKPSNSIERPKPLPTGTYLAMVKGQPRYDKSKQKGTRFAEFTLQLLQHGEDVDGAAIKEYLGARQLNAIEIKDTYYLTDEAAYRLKEFVDHCGVENAEGATLGQRVSQTPGCQLLISIAHKPSDDGTRIYANVRQTAAVAT